MTVPPMLVGLRSRRRSSGSYEIPVVRSQHDHRVVEIAVLLDPVEDPADDPVGVAGLEQVTMLDEGDRGVPGPSSRSGWCRKGMISGPGL